MYDTPSRELGMIYVKSSLNLTLQIIESEITKNFISIKSIPEYLGIFMLQIKAIEGKVIL